MVPPPSPLPAVAGPGGSNFLAPCLRKSSTTSVSLDTEHSMSGVDGKSSVSTASMSLILSKSLRFAGAHKARSCARTGSSGLVGPVRETLLRPAYSFAPCFLSNPTISVWPLCFAHCRAVRSRRPFASTSAPWSRRNSTTSAWPDLAALCKGVSPDFNLVFTSAPAAINSFTTSLYPLANQQRSSYEELKVKY